MSPGAIRGKGVARGRTIAAALLAQAALAGCAGHPHGVMTPVAGETAGTGRVAMVVATTRAADPRPGFDFSGARSRATSYALVDVSIPPEAARVRGEVQWPESLPGDPRTDFVVRRDGILTRAEALADVAALAGRSPKHRVLLFVHGFNNRYEDAVYRFAQIVHDSGSTDAPVLFTWPSKASVLAYGYDRDSATASRDRLEELIATLSADPKVSGIAILAHSMGNWVTLEALRQAAIRRGATPSKVDDVILAAPDVDVDVAREQIAAMGPRRPRFSLFTSRDDKALKLSADISQDHRLGEADPTREPLRSDLARERIAVYDLSGVQGAGGPGLGHDVFASNAEVVRLIGSRLADGQSVGDAPRRGFASSLTGGFGAATGFAGGLAGLAVDAPSAILDPDARETYGERLRERTGLGEPGR